MCGAYANKWKIEFSVDKCNWLVFGKELYDDGEFILNGVKIRKEQNSIYLGLPIGEKAFVNDFLKEKFNKVEKFLLFVHYGLQA